MTDQFTRSAPVTDREADSNSDGPIRIDWFRPHDMPAMWALAECVRPGESVDVERWQWQYERNPHAAEPDVAVAWDGNKLVGQLAAMPMTATVFGKELEACWQMDSMVDPAYRRRGIATLLLKHYAKRHLLRIALGTSDAMFALMIKEGWVHVRPCPLLVRPLNVMEVLEPKLGIRWAARAIGYLYDRLRPLNSAHDSRLSRVTEFDSAATDLWERVAPHLTIGVRRDARFLNWRYGKVPRKEYICLEFRAADGRLRGYCVAGSLRKPGMYALVDILAMPDDEEAMMALTTEALRLARAARASRMCAIATDPRVLRILAKCGFLRTRYQARLTCASLGGSAIVPQDSASWYITMGDSDEELNA